MCRLFRQSCRYRHRHGRPHCQCLSPCQIFRVEASHQLLNKICPMAFSVLRKHSSPKQPIVCREGRWILLTWAVGRLFGGGGRMGLNRDRHSSCCTSQLICYCGEQGRYMIWEGFCQTVWGRSPSASGDCVQIMLAMCSERKQTQCFVNLALQLVVLNGDLEVHSGFVQTEQTLCIRHW